MHFMQTTTFNECTYEPACLWVIIDNNSVPYHQKKSGYTTAFGTHTHTHTHTDTYIHTQIYRHLPKSDFRKPGTCQPASGMRLV